MGPSYLEFEQPLAALDARLAELRARPEPAARRARRRAEAERRTLARTVYGRLSAWQRVQLARHVDRPGTLDYVRRLCRDFFELRGDRRFGDDPAIVAGIGHYRGASIAVVGHQRGHTARERIRRNFGMASPEGHRKALRVFRLAERLGLPLVTLIDTQGAYPGIGAEERGQAEAIARNLRAMAVLRVPIVSVVIGEGGSGGALALAVGDRVLMQEYACYSVISPEGCASILYRRQSERLVSRAAEALRLTAADLAGFAMVDALVPEPLGGAHRDPVRAARALDRCLAAHLDALRAVPVATLLRRRHQRYRRMGAHVG